ncbi:serine/threonine protein kinase [Catenulispora acidiphila DSM 44928]|uniref:non-specific serine/threonine protein kinase n=1 Tax=Catenulispora acidiphila (strain DSM 44928 / JCM 14897 / NBRC 102108 / NRRL B-24433 / ID139908) TaxID=479433 RepID=C7PZD0_CATAD|nr:serine/threonine protein kinase [Catenulispora acidiphila DSM 44928]
MDGAGNTGEPAAGAGARPVEVPDGFVVGRWRVTGYLGSGSWGSVYLGEAVGDAAVDGDPAEVALKFLPPSVGTPGRRALLAEVVDRERRFSESIEHPALIRTVAVETAESGDAAVDGATVLVMERGVSNVRQLLQNGADLGDGERILAEVCSALAFMHDAGWVHGDVKPGNVLLMADGSARLADFGVTTELDGTHAYAPRIGSSDYLPPEWWSEQVGEQGIALRPTADIWAFGILTHQVLAGGRHPFAGASPHARAMSAQAYAHTGEGLLLDERIAEPWRSLIRDCLAPDHARRGAVTARSLAERIGRAGGSGHGDRSAHSEHSEHGTAQPTGPSTRRRVLIPAVAVAAVVAIVAVAATVLVLKNGSQGKTAASSPHTGTVTGPAAAPATGAAGSPRSAPALTRGELRPDAAVPAEYRDVISRAAHACPTPEVTPAMVAAVLKVESGFDPKFSSPATDSYGIAGWTPRVFTAWAPGPRADYMNPDDAIMAAGQYLCWLDEEFIKEHPPGDLAALTVAAYDTSTKAVSQANGVPPNAVEFTNSVLEYAREYAG